MLRLSLDLETYLMTEECITPQPVCMTWSDGNDEGKAGIVHARDPRFWSLLSSWLSDPNVELVWHNGMAFDVPVLVAHAPDQDRVDLIRGCLREGRMTDTKIRQWLGDTAEGRFRGFSRLGDKLIKHGYALADCAVRAGLPPMHKGEDTYRLRYAELDHVPIHLWPPEAVDYAKKDAYIAARVAVWQDVRWGDEVLASQYEEFRGYFALAMMAAHGMPTDPERVALYKAHLLETRDRYQDRLVVAGLIERRVVNRGKENEYIKITCKQEPTRALYAKLCEEYGIEPAKTEKGAFSVTEDTVNELEAAAGPDFVDEELEMLTAAVEYKHSGQLLSRDIIALERPIVRTSYGWTGTARVSSSKGNKEFKNGMNLQNQAKKGFARECFIPPPGYLLCSSDYNQAELVGVSDICKSYFGFSRLGDLINEGKDIHIYLGSILAGEPVGDGPWRDAAKMGNFGLWGGMGADAFEANARKRKMAIDGAKMISAWRTAYPEHKPYFARAAEIVNNCDGMVQNYVGDFWRKVDRFTQACNTPFQNLIARISKRACWYLVDAALGGELPICPLLQVHDENLFAVPDDGTQHEVAYAATSLMVTAAEDFLRHVKMTAAPALMRRWYKGAKPTFDLKGRLIPWEPQPKG